MATTVADIIAKVRTRIDQDGFNQLDDTDHLLPWTSDSYGRLWALVTGANPDAVMQQKAFSLAAGVSTYDIVTTGLVTDFWKLLGVEDANGNDVPRFLWNARNRVSQLSHCLIGNVINFRPTGSAPGSYVAYYLPSAPKLTATTGGAGTLDDRVVQNGWDMFVVHDVCVTAQTRLKKDAAAFEKGRKAIEDELTALANDRNISEPRYIEDVQDNGDPLAWSVL